MTAAVRLAEAELEKARADLARAEDLVPKGPRTLVCAVVDGKAVEVPVQVSSCRGYKAVVRGDLPPGARVIVRGNERVRAGQSVATAE